MDRYRTYLSPATKDWFVSNPNLCIDFIAVISGPYPTKAAADLAASIFRLTEARIAYRLVRERRGL